MARTSLVYRMNKLGISRDHRFHHKNAGNGGGNSDLFSRRGAGFVALAASIRDVMNATKRIRGRFTSACARFCGRRRVLVLSAGFLATLTRTFGFILVLIALFHTSVSAQTQPLP